MRHGRTQWNAANRFQGRTDVPLSEEGIAQARAIAIALAEETFDSLYSSDLSRALQTAKAIVENRDLEVRPDRRLREFDFGAWEGLTWDEILARFPDAAPVEATSARYYAPPQGESFEMVRARVRSFLDKLAVDPASRIAVVTHAGVLHAFIAEMFGDSLAADAGIRFAPASITRVEFEGGGPQLVALGDVRHLA